MFKILRSFLKTAVALVCLVVVLAWAAPTERYFEIAKNLDIFATLFREVNAHYVDEVDPDILIRSGIDAMLLSLDPYTNYISEEEVESFRTLTTGQYAGIGALIGQIDSSIIVTSMYEGFAAHRAGIKIGDELISIDGVKIKGQHIPEISSMLKGPAKSEVTIVLKRFNHSEPLSYTFSREKITISNVPYFGMINDQIGYIKLEEFTPGAGKETSIALKQLKSKGAKSIVLDLRDNLGGLLGEAVNVANVFTPKNKEVVSTKGKVTEWNKTYKTLNNPEDTNIPLVVLINGNSASAAEIVAGVIQDYDRGLLIGTKTFGKGLVQTTRPLTYNSQLKVTTAKYYIPSGRCIQALDYSHRNDDGTVNRVPDSLKMKFSTKHGRAVYDGAGIDPDILVTPITLAPITKSLIAKAHVFYYSTEFANRSESNLATFKMTDAEYDNFVKWLGGKDYDYTTHVEQQLKDLEASVQEGKYMRAIQPKIEELKLKISHSKEKDLITYKDQIKEVLETEIASRYALKKGKVEASFDDDQVIKKTVETLQDRKTYNSLIKGN